MRRTMFASRFAILVLRAIPTVGQSVQFTHHGNIGFAASLALTLDNQPKWSLATVSPGQFQIFNDATGQNAVWIDPATNNLGIGTSPSFKLHVNDPSNTGLRVQTGIAGQPDAEPCKALPPTNRK